MSLKSRHVQFKPSGTCAADEPMLPYLRLLTLRILVVLNGMDSLISESRTTLRYVAATVGMELDIESPDKGEIHKQILQAFKQAEHDAATTRPSERFIQNLASLAIAFGLDDVEQQILGVAALIHMENALSPVVELLGTISTSKTIHALSVLTGADANVVRYALRLDGKLARSSLLCLDRGTRSLRNKLDIAAEDFPDYLVNEPFDTRSLFRNRITLAKPAELTLEHFKYLQPELNAIIAYLRRTIDHSEKGVNIFLYGAPGLGKTQLSRVIAEQLNVTSLCISHEDEDNDPVSDRERIKAICLAQHLHYDQNAMLTIDEADVFDTIEMGIHRLRTSKGFLHEILENNRLPTIWISNERNVDPAILSRFTIVLEVPLLPRSHRKELISRLCTDDLICADTVSRLANTSDLDTRAVRHAAQVVRALGELGAEMTERSQMMVSLINHALSARHGKLVPAGSKAIPDYYDPTLVNASIPAQQLSHGLRQIQDWRLCFYGPPGTGKTALAYWLANQLEKPLNIVRTSELLSRYPGETERRIANAFSAAAREEAILLLEEGDSLMRDRRWARHSWEITQVNEILVQMESYSGCLIVNTNFFDALDLASRRRFDELIEFYYLGSDQAWQLLIRTCQLIGLSSPEPESWVDFALLNKLTPGDFESSMRGHRFNPIRSVQQLIDALKMKCKMKEQ